MKRIKIRFSRLKILVDIFLGYYPDDSEKKRKENIEFLFVHTFHYLSECQRQYDECYRLYGKHDRALAESLNILSDVRQDYI